MKKYIFILAAVILAACTACEGSGTDKPRHHKRSILTPASAGTPYEMLVVADNDIWNDSLGWTIQRMLDTPVPMLPQEEPSFHVSHVDFAHYNRITNLFRNIILIKKNDNFTKPKISVERNVHSEPQLIMTIQGPDWDELTQYVKKCSDMILQYFSAEEINRYATDLEVRYSQKFDEQCMETFGCHIHIPADLKKIKVGKDFLWASNDGLSTIQNICVYSYPYVSEKVFTRHAYIALRDTFMKRNIPGEHPGQWMQTNHDYVQLRDISSRGVYVQEARGLWEMHNDWMGGPFVAHSMVDTINGKIIVAEAFVFAPSKMKRTMIRRLEASLFTLEMPAAQDKQQDN